MGHIFRQKWSYAAHQKWFPLMLRYRCHPHHCRVFDLHKTRDDLHHPAEKQSPVERNEDSFREQNVVYLFTSSLCTKVLSDRQCGIFVPDQGADLGGGGAKVPSPLPPILTLSLASRLPSNLPPILSRNSALLFQTLQEMTNSTRAGVTIEPRALLEVTLSNEERLVIGQPNPDITIQPHEKLPATQSCVPRLCSQDQNRQIPNAHRLGTSRSSGVQTTIVDAFNYVGKKKVSSSAFNPVETGSLPAENHPDTEKSRICDPSDPAAGVSTDRHQFAAMVRKGPFQPSLSEYPITRFGGKKRAFRKAWYAVHDWLEYSIITDKTFCFVCRLFGKENSGKGGHSDPAFVSTGFSNREKATQAFATHERCDFHVGCKEALFAFKTQKGVDEQLDDQKSAVLKAKEQVRLRNRRLIAQLAEVVRMLCRGGRPFRGHDESNDSQEKRLFLEVIHLIAKYDDQLQEHLKAGPKNATYLSNKTQNELIAAMHNVMLRKIQGKLFGKRITIIADETSDCGHHEQLAVVIRYAEDDGSSQEVFVGLRRLLKTDAQTIFNELCAVLGDLNLTWDQTACVCFDGANNMSGQHGGRKMESFSIFSFLYSFIEGSPTRHAVFERVVVRGGDRLKALKTLSTTRWAARSEAVSAVREQFESIVKATEEVIDTSSAPNVKAKGKGLLAQLKSFNFILALYTTDFVLRLINIVNKTLQSSTVSVSASLKAIDSLKIRLKDLRNDSSFRDFFEDAVAMCEKLSVDVPAVRNRKPVRKPDSDSVSEAVFSSKEEEVRVKFYFPLLDSLLDGLEERFDQESTAALRAFEKVLNLEANCEETALVAGLVEVKAFDLQAEMSLLTTQRNEIVGKEPEELISWLGSTGQEAMFENYAKVAKTLSVYPVSSCKAERAFSKMAIVKMKLRSTMLQKRLNAIMLPFVEQQLCNEICIEDVVDEFDRLTGAQRRFAL
ncbi:conserved hypothetical protein [Culex quinquefasciatus]|uniref:TTF-type domain-containing protein n=1 Tax=Culex quinquefasciatus TaxID=7176 RepID=B0XBX6_CULQU|nr:conserved hypothetical protein [Culex quinquefasciatus]|eukprot:XP_001867148.1 conserved hypothetical protein [Culex quinquefasciatus]